MNSLQEDIKTQSSWLVKAFREDGFKLDYSLDSLRELDNFFDAHTKNGKAIPNGRLTQNTGSIIFSVGAYLGETMIRNNPGSFWQVDDNDPAGEMNAIVHLTDDSIIWPMERAMKRFTNGSEDGFYVYGVLLSGGESSEGIFQNPTTPSPSVPTLNSRQFTRAANEKVIHTTASKPWWKFW